MIASNAGSSSIWASVCILKDDLELFHRIKTVLDYAIDRRDTSHDQFLDSAKERFNARVRGDISEEDYGRARCESNTARYGYAISVVYGGFLGLVCMVPLTPFYFAGELIYNWKKGNLSPPTALENIADTETEPKIDPETEVFMQYAT